MTWLFNELQGFFIPGERLKGMWTVFFLFFNSLCKSVKLFIGIVAAGRNYTATFLSDWRWKNEKGRKKSSCNSSKASYYDALLKAYDLSFKCDYNIMFYIIIFSCLLSYLLTSMECHYFFLMLISIRIVTFRNFKM
jgi:hypothetical protein